MVREQTKQQDSLFSIPSFSFMSPIHNPHITRSPNHNKYNTAHIKHHTYLNLLETVKGHYIDYMQTQHACTVQQDACASWTINTDLKIYIYIFKYGSYASELTNEKWMGSLMLLPLMLCHCWVLTLSERFWSTIREEVHTGHICLSANIA